MPKGPIGGRSAVGCYRVATLACTPAPPLIDGNPLGTANHLEWAATTRGLPFQTGSGKPGPRWLDENWWRVLPYQVRYNPALSPSGQFLRTSCKLLPRGSRNKALQGNEVTTAVMQVRCKSGVYSEQMKDQKGRPASRWIAVASQYSYALGKGLRTRGRLLTPSIVGTGFLNLEQAAPLIRQSIKRGALAD